MKNRRTAIVLGLLCGLVLLLLSVAGMKWWATQQEYRAQIELSRLGGTYTMSSASSSSFFDRFISGPVVEVDLSVTAWPRETATIPPVTDADLEVISSLTRLKRLSLQGMPITDASIEQLIQFRHLEYLDIRETQISEQGLQELQAALPDCVLVVR